MNIEKVKLIIKNMELLIQSLKLEIEDEKESDNVIRLDELFANRQDNLSNYDPDYYEEP